jgi:fatty-acyl-CoA synthase
MQLAFSNLAAPGWSLEHTLAAVREYGYDGLELRLLDGDPIDPMTIDEAARRDVERTLKASEVPLACFDTSVKLATAFGEGLAAALELAALWGAPLVRVFGGELDDSVSRDEALDRIADELAPLLERADELGVGVALETHDSFSTSASVDELLRRVEHARLGALWDIDHTNRMGESPLEVVRVLGDRIVHVHVDDARRVDDGWELVLLGEGDVPWRESMSELRAAGYEGWVSVEWEKRWHPELAEPEVALPQHAALLR